MEMLYIVQSFHGIDDGMVGGKPILHAMEPLARRRGEELARQCDGVLVYAQAADVDRDEYSMPVVLASYGHVPQLKLPGRREPTRACAGGLPLPRERMDGVAAPTMWLGLVPVGVPEVASLP